MSGAPRPHIDAGVWGKVEGVVMALTGRGSDQFSLRFPEGLREKIKAAADFNGRSMNAEILMTLTTIYLNEATAGETVRQKEAKMANEERKPLSELTLRRTLNGGWVIDAGNGDHMMRPDTYSYSSDRDMLAALPGLIGAKRPGDDMEFLEKMLAGTDVDPTEYPNAAKHLRDQRIRHGFTDRERSDDAVEATKAEMLARRSDVPNLGNAPSPMINPLATGIV